MGNDTDFEKKVLSGLKSLGFSIVSYYPYDSRSDILGYLKPSPPLTVPIKTLVTVIRGDTTVDKIESSHKIARDGNVAKFIIFSPSNEQDIDKDVIDFVHSLGAEFIDRKKLEDISPSIKPKDHDLSILENLAPLKLINSLPDFAKQEIPKNIEDIVGNDIEAWRLFEQAVFSAFKEGFSYDARQLGSAVLFEKEPEGVVITSGIKFGFIYECKSAKDVYQMTSDHEAKYIQYIQKKKLEVSAIYNTELKYFVLVGPKFAGDKELRRQNVFKNTNVLLIYLKASTLKTLASWALGVPESLKKLIDLSDVFKLSEEFVSDETVKGYINTFDTTYRNRW